MIRSNEAVITHLNTVLANGILFYQKLHNYHWNVEGNRFFELHEKFEELYDQWAEYNDAVAERVLTVGGRPLPTLADVIDKATLSEDPSKPDAEAMANNVLEDMRKMHEEIQAAIAAADAAGDRGTTNLLDGQSDEIEKTMWMFRALLAKDAAVAHA